MATDLVLYWDTSAIISALFKDSHSDEAWATSHKEGYHLVSSLAVAETYAVIARMARENKLASVLADAAVDAFKRGPWRLIQATPEPEDMAILACQWPLRGADLWHLALAKNLKAHLPELIMFTFDDRLRSASSGEGL